MSILMPKMMRVMAKILVRSGDLSWCMRSVPYHDARAAPVAAMATMRQSMWTEDDGRALLSVATRAVMTMMAREVAMAFLCCMPRAAVNAGTMTMPPPTPQRAPRRPAMAPMVRAMRMVGMRKKVKVERLKAGCFGDASVGGSNVWGSAIRQRLIGHLSLVVDDETLGCGERF